MNGKVDINSLYKSILDGDTNSEKQLFEKLSVRFRLFVSRKVRNEQDREDIVQSSLMIVFDKYKDVEIKSSFAGWSYKILENKMNEYYRKARTEKKAGFVSSTDDSTVEKAASRSNTPLETKILDCLRKMNKTNPRYARILNLHHLGFKTKEICIKMSITPQNLYMILSRSRSLLEQCLKGGRF
ncbi:MAG: sigma-70 family RNA polymerase sigma factor [candidate division Zixibacteria bacterium]|nr:sigma-70 family RNA polymerase sigma factor [candidate division Zixibacteria bacterium]